jgi:hypothetical protein
LSPGDGVDVEYLDEKPALCFFCLACALLFLNFRMRWLLWLLLLRMGRV